MIRSRRRQAYFMICLIPQICQKQFILAAIKRPKDTLQPIVLSLYVLSRSQCPVSETPKRTHLA